MQPSYFFSGMKKKILGLLRIVNGEPHRELANLGSPALKTFSPIGNANFEPSSHALRKAKLLSTYSSALVHCGKRLRARRRERPVSSGAAGVLPVIKGAAAVVIRLDGICCPNTQTSEGYPAEA